MTNGQIVASSDFIELPPALCAAYRVQCAAMHGVQSGTLLGFISAQNVIANLRILIHATYD